MFRSCHSNFQLVKNPTDHFHYDSDKVAFRNYQKITAEDLRRKICHDFVDLFSPVTENILRTVRLYVNR